MTETMRIWDAVSKTDPTYTKNVNQRGGFTSVNANSQIMEATRQFGPIGKGWGYTTESVEVHGTVVMAMVTLWHGTRDNVFGPMPGCAEILGKRTDTDAPKKATTDAITKLLSQLGFNADIFLGMWDDNKYVQQREQEVARENAPKPTPQVRKDNMEKALKGSETIAALENLWGGKNFAGAFKELPKHLQDQLTATYEDLKKDGGE